jgi:predicted Zn-dependent peptidase
MPLIHSVKEIVLKNGARGLLILVPGTTSVYYEIEFRAGNNYVVRPEISQVAHILEHMAFATSSEFPSIELFSQEFTKNGAYSNAHTGSIGLSYEAEAGIMEWERIMSLQRLSVTHPVYTQQLLDAEKGNVREEITGYENNTSRILWQEIMRRADLKRWYDADEIKTIETVTLADITEHYTRTHTTHNMRFVIAGDLEAHIPALIEQFEGWELPAGELFPIEQEKAHSTGLVHIERNEMHNLCFALDFFLNRTLDRKELRAMNALSHILTDTFHSRIYGAARSRGLCYGISSWVGTNSTGVSEFGLSGEVSFDNAHDLFQLIIEQLQIISKDGVTEDELYQAKQYRLGSLQMGLSTVNSLADWYGGMYYETGEIDDVEAFPALITGTTVSEMKQLAAEFLTSGIWTFGGIGNISEQNLQQHYDLFAKELVAE